MSNIDFRISDGILLKYIGNNLDIIIPDSIISIGSYAFRDYKDLKSVTIPGSVQALESGHSQSKKSRPFTQLREAMRSNMH